MSHGIPKTLSVSYFSINQRTKLIYTLKLDASHDTLAKRLNRVKLIVGMASSFTSEQVENKVDRGVPVCAVMATAENAEIHEAILAALRMRMPQDWKLEVLMTDLAYSANNAFFEYFPEMQWVW